MCFTAAIFIFFSSFVFQKVCSACFVLQKLKLTEHFSPCFHSSFKDKDKCIVYLPLEAVVRSKTLLSLWPFLQIRVESWIFFLKLTHKNLCSTLFVLAHASVLTRIFLDCLSFGYVKWKKRSVFLSFQMDIVRNFTTHDLS